MGEALKKHLAKLEVKPGDLVLFKPPLGAQPTEWRGFVMEVAQQLAIDNLGPVVVVQPGFQWDTLTNEQLNGMGMMRLWPPGESTIPLEVLEDQAQAAVRIAFANARQLTEERIARSAAADDDEEPREYDPLLDFDYSAPDPPPGTAENP